MAPERPTTSAEVAIDAPIKAVFALLADPKSYADWVVGSDKVLRADPGWPAPGSAFEHVVGVWPFKSHDHSYVEDVQAPIHLRLRVKARPFVTAHVWLDLSEQDGGTLVQMQERGADPLSKLVMNRFTQPLVKTRNELALRRLRDMAEGKRPVPTADEAAR